MADPCDGGVRPCEDRRGRRYVRSAIGAVGCGVGARRSCFIEPREAQCPDLRKEAFVTVIPRTRSSIGHRSALVVVVVRVSGAGD